MRQQKAVDLAADVAHRQELVQLAAEAPVTTHTPGFEWDDPAEGDDDGQRRQHKA
jgi:hypothetical protein